MPASTGVDRLYNATGGGKTEANFLEVLRGCGEAEVKYRDGAETTVLMRMAIYHDWPKAAAAVIRRGCDVSATYMSGNTALHFASEHNRHETARVLLERGADRTIKNKGGDTAAGFARFYGQEDIAEEIQKFI